MGMTRRALLWAPLIVFLILVGVVAIGLWKPADRTVRSALVGKPVPAFYTPPLLPGRPGLTDADFRQGRVRLLNVFASWCVPCIAEAPQLMRLKQMGVPIDAVAIRDTAPAVQAFFARHGDPYQRLGDDKNSAVQLALGSSGVPETFVIGGDGTILEQHIGDIRPDDVDRLARLAGVR
jgi:cytochrome c biogenesis protein CcmG, thiol:disulfide interchange protein DsbE